MVNWRRLVPAVIVMAIIGLSLAISRASAPVTEAGPRSVDKVALFAVPGLSIDDLDDGPMPSLDLLATEGSIAVANVRIKSAEPNLTGAYASLGAGNRTRGSDADVLAYDPSDRVGGVTVAEAMRAVTGAVVDGTVLVPTAPQVAEELRPEGGSEPGALADALHRAGRRTAIVGNAGERNTGTEVGRRAPAALAVATPSGEIDEGSVSTDLLQEVPGPDGQLQTVTDDDAFLDAVGTALDRADVVMIDPGETTRAQRAAEKIAEEVDAEPPVEAGEPGERDAPDRQDEAEQLRIDALARTDRLIGEVRRQLDTNTLLLVVGVTPPSQAWALTPVVAAGSGVTPGYLASASTHRPGLVTLTDLAPTILETLEVEVPPTMIGAPLRYRSADASWDQARRLDDLLESQASVSLAMTVTFIVVQSVVYGIAFLVLASGRGPRALRRVLEVGALACGAWPVTTFLLRMGTSLYSLGPGTFVLSWLIAVALALGALRFRRHPLDPVLAVAGLTVFVLVIDLATGSHLQLGSFFGYPPQTAPRFIGLGNSAFAILAGATLATIGLIVSRARDLGRDEGQAWWLGLTVAVLVVFAIGAPWTGADVGGTLAFVPVVSLMLWVLRGGRVRWQSLIAAAALGVLVLGIGVGVEALRDPSERTHIGRFFLDPGDGSGIIDTLARKWDSNTAAIRQSPGTLAVPLVVAFGVIVIGRMPAFRRRLALRPTIGTTVLATLAAGTTGWLLNDSGLIVLALTCVLLGPLIVLFLFRDPAPTSSDPDLGIVSHDRAAGQATSRVDDLMDPDPLAPALGPTPTVVALVPAKDRADSVSDTVVALSELSLVDRVLVIDDGSSDDTADRALAAGAEVLRLASNRGKGAAIRAGAEATPDADIYLLIDADLARTASAAEALLTPVLDDRADLVIGILPPAAGRGGFGAIKQMAGRGVARACGFETVAPLSGQRAIRADLLRDLRNAERFGLEVAMTIDTVRADGRVLEVEVPMDHRHTGRSLSGFVHRGRQGLDIAAALLPRLTTARQRIAALLGLTVLLSAVAVFSGSRTVPATDALPTGTERVLIFGMEPFGFDDLGTGATPNLDRLAQQGALGAMSVRTVGRRPTPEEGYLSMGAGARLSAGGLAGSILPAEQPVPSADSVAQYVERLTGTAPEGSLVAIAGPDLSARNVGPASANVPGALAEALSGAGSRTAAIGNSDRPETIASGGVESRPVGLAAMKTDYGIDRGVVTPEELLTADASAPFGVRADPDAVVEATRAALDDADLVVVDPGDLTRAQEFGRDATEATAARQWNKALEGTDAMLGRIVADLDRDTVVMVVSVAPPEGQPRLTPFVVWSKDGPSGTATSPSTRRTGLVALTDVAPTVLDLLGVPVPVDFPGNAVRYEPGPVDRGALRTMDADTVVREATYGPQSKGYIWVSMVVFLLGLVVIAPRPRFSTLHGTMRWAVLSLTAYPAATFLVRLVPGLTTTSFDRAQTVCSIGLAALGGWAASRARRRPLSALAWVLGVTVAVIVIDTWTGTRLETSSWLGYSLHNAGRFYGVPNTTFAILGAATLVLGGIIVDHASRRAEAVWAVGCLFFLVLVSAGLPMLGADVGSLITLFPIFALVLVVLAGRRIRLGVLLMAGAAMIVLVTAAAGVDLARPAADRTHLGQFAQRALDEGPSALVDTFDRKQSANVRIADGSVWTRLALAVAAFLFVPLVWHRRGRELFPPGSAVRTCSVAVAAAALLGLISNDSGPLVVSLFVAILPALVILIVLDGRRSASVLMSPAQKMAQPPAPAPPA